MSSASAGTRNERTTSVSSSTPTATSRPMCSTNTTGRLASPANVAASTMPALVITPPVTASARSTPGRCPTRPTSSLALVIRKIV
jgi:hypothetical protein